MKRMDDLIQAVTYRFGPDAELQREIARELRAHLEDAVAAVRAGGMDEAHAEETAVRAFGDPEEIAEKLWQANRRRMRIRAAAKWSARLVLMPAGILLALCFCSATLEALAFAWLAHWMTGNAPELPWSLLPAQRTQEWILREYAVWPVRSNLTEEQRLLLAADQSPYTEWNGAIPEAWKRLMAAYPGSAIYPARCFAKFAVSDLNNNIPLLPSHRDLFDQAMSLLDAGERADAENAFWNYMKADLLMYVSGAAKQEEDPTFTYVGSAKSKPAPHGMKLLFTGRPLFERGLAEYRKGLAKPYYRSYAEEMEDELATLHPPPDTLLLEMQAVKEWAGVLLPDLSKMRNMTRGIMAYSRLLIQEGHPQEAEKLIQTSGVPGAQVGADCRLVIELLVACAMRQAAFRQGAALYEQLGKPAQAAEALALAHKESQQEGNFLKNVPEKGEEERFMTERGGILGGILGGGLFGARIPLSDFSIPVNLARAERFLAERAALGVLALLYLIAVCWLGTWTAWQLWRHRKDTRGPKLYFVGWRRLGWIALLALLLPLLAYALLTRALPFGSAHYGINYDPVRIALEMGTAVALILGLSLYLAWRAARARCRGADITDRKELWMSARRSMLPILVACFLLVGIVSEAYLRCGESSAVQALSQPGRRPFLDEMNYVAWKDYRDYLRALPDHGALPADEIRR
jgi:hypothetical protein